MKTKQNLGSRIRGWFPQEPLQRNYATNISPMPKTKADLDKKLVKNGRIANIVIVLVFFTLNSLILQPHYNYQPSIEVGVVVLGVLVLVLAAVNLTIYWHYKKQLQAGNAYFCPEKRV